eukprot:gene13564-14964_t
MRMGKPAAALIEKCPIWEQLGQLMQKETVPNYDSDSTDEGDEIFVTAIRRPLEVDMDLFNKCAEELAKIESFLKIDDQAIQARRSDKIKALILLPRGLFRALSEKELLSITESIQQMGISNLLFNTARKLEKKWLTDRNMMATTCGLGMALLDRVIVPELITEYLAKRYNLRRNELTQEITMGPGGQLLYQVHLKEQESTIARKKITDEDTLYQVIAGKLTDKEVGAIVVGLNQFLEAEESQFLDMMPHEMLRKHLLTDNAGRVDQGTVLHLENSDEKHSWSTIFVIEPVYDYEQRRSCINSLEAVVQKYRNRSHQSHQPLPDVVKQSDDRLGEVQPSIYVTKDNFEYFQPPIEIETEDEGNKTYLKELYIKAPYQLTDAITEIIQADLPRPLAIKK